MASKTLDGSGEVCVCLMAKKKKRKQHKKKKQQHNIVSWMKTCFPLVLVNCLISLKSFQSKSERMKEWKNGKEIEDCLKEI